MCAPKSSQLISKIDQTKFKPLFKTKTSLHASAMVFNWIIIVSAIVLYQVLSSPWVYPLAVLIIGARMHALAILMHDATHFRFLKNRKWNDLITNLFIMYPIFTTIEEYRANHLKHHQHLNTEHDPDWVAKLTKREFHFPKTKAEFILTILSYLVFYQGILDAIWFAKRYKAKDKKEERKSDINTTKIAFYVVLYGLLTVFGMWKVYLLFWVVPYITSFFMFQYIRSVAEHYGDMAYEDELSSSRTVKPTLFERFFIAPHNVGFHLEHHLFPGVPFYNLPKLHDLLMEDEEYNKKAHITKGYLSGLLLELGAEKHLGRAY